MTRLEAEARATEIAESLNWPWDPTNLSVRTWRVWPFQRVWRVESRVVDSGAIAWMRVGDRSRAMLFGQVFYPAGGLKGSD